MSPAAFVLANLRRRPLHNLLGLAGVTMAFTLYGLALGSAEGFRRAALLHHVNIGEQFLYAAMAVSAAGMLLILFLEGVAMAQTVRLRLYELGILKALGFSTRRIVALMVAEAAVPGLAGATLGLIAAKLLSLLLVMLPPPPGFPPLAYTPGIVGTGLVFAGLIALFSTAIPAARIVRIDAATALTGRGPVLPRDSMGARETNFPAKQVPAAVHAPDAVTSADLRLLWQIIVVTRIGLLTLRKRFRGALTIIVSVGCVVVALLPLSSVGEGIRVGLLASGDPNRVVVHTATSWIIPRNLPDSTARIVAAAPGVARAANGTPLVEGESFGHILELTKRNNGEAGNTAIVGAGPLWPVMTPAFRLLEGRLPRPGTRELIAGNLARRKFSGLDSGVLDKVVLGVSSVGRLDRVSLDGPWRIVGTFTTGSWWDGYLVADAAGFKRYAQHPADTIVLARLTSPQAFSGFARALAGRLPSNIIVDRETDYYAGIWRIIPDTGWIVAYTLAGLIGMGTMAAIAQIMNGALEERRREIAALRALGFDVRAIAASVMLEGLLLAISGALAGAAAVWLWMDGFLVNGAVTVIRATVDLHLLLVSLAWAFVIALCGTIPLAARMIRQTEMHTLQNL
jgi:putative ABC transport system permease protein